MSGIIRSSFRSLTRAPGVSVVVIATLAIGIALVIGMITLLNGYAWAALPYENADRIMAIGISDGYGAMDALPKDVVEQVRAMHSTFSSVAAWNFTDQSLRVDGAPTLVEVIEADESLLPLLGAHPAAGRLFTQRDGDAVAVISNTSWRRDFAHDPNVVGRTIYTKGIARTVIGVLPEEFGFENGAVFVPLHITEADGAKILARLAPGATAAAARSRVRALQLPPGWVYDKYSHVDLNPDMTQRDPMSHAGSMLLMFILATAFVLLIACANVVTILLARGVARSSQYSIRAAIGAGRRRLFLENIAESALLALTATAIGVVLAAWAIRIFVATLGTAFPSWLRFPIDAHIVLASGVVALFVVLCVGWLPAWDAARGGPISLLNTLTVTRGIRESRIGRFVVSAEIALSAALFIGTMLLVRSFSAASHIDVGYNDRNIAVADIRLDATEFHNVVDVDRYLDRAVNAIRTSGAGDETFIGEFGGFRNAIGDTVPAYASGFRLMINGQTRYNVFPSVPDDRYFRMLGLRIIYGRAFNATDSRTSPLVAIVSSSLAAVVWPKEMPVGRSIRVDSAGTTATVVGVVQDLTDTHMGRDGITVSPREQVYFSPQQAATRNVTFMLHGTGAGNDLVRALRTKLNEADPNVALFGPPQMLHDKNLAVTKTLTIFGWLFGSIATVALVLALIGLFGIIAYSAQQRTREIGVRIALGAGPRRIAFDIMRQAMEIILVGLGLGFVLSLVIGIGLRGFMYGITVTDPVTYIVVTMTFAAVALLAAWLPSRRAIRINPINALRPE